MNFDFEIPKVNCIFPDIRGTLRYRCSRIGCSFGHKQMIKAMKRVSNLENEEASCKPFQTYLVVIWALNRIIIGHTQ